MTLPRGLRGLPRPYMITPETTEEAMCGKATLIAAGDFDVIVRGIHEVAPERTDLIAKFERLRSG